MNATLYRRRDKKKIAEVNDAGNGGPMRITRFLEHGGPTMNSTADYNGFLDAVGKLPPDDSCGMKLDVNDEIAIGVLAEVEEMFSIIRKSRKNRFLFILPSHQEGAVSQMDFPTGTTTERAAAHIRQKYPEAVVVNELLHHFSEAFTPEATKARRAAR